jgi:hypothetical protein
MKINLCVKKPILLAYLQYLFPTDDQGAFVVNRDSDFGKALCCFVRYSNIAQKEEPDDTMVTLKLPMTRTLDTAPKYHLYFTKEDQHRVNDLLDVFFHLDFDRYYLKGIKMGYMQKHVIESFILSRKLSTLYNDNETLKKREYREGLKLLEAQVEKLRQKAHYRNHRIEVNPEKYLTI